ncbi:Putative NADPH-quinone reductase (modulator of drug activity B) [Gracilibacillus orientalis]|uniref:Putative NADPH-quinone reductase (Modulator of drug activity B) n=1 Tax=Gracilibacillus orientalis TaxID=334253 RepID=A0A1I4H2Y8_9BACI|nr:NAD(P)H-dependent oxidoreductase [Gracilibacillus orientalis]SFL36007.1 Putative NADPH-quinone reductase (modulator of drug activity B) [Gracilibacillus orientalis]
MTTLLIISHPDMIESSSQQYFLSSIKNQDDITIHHLENLYPDSHINVAKEQELLRQHDRIIFQFPFYWYSTTPLIKKWQDEVLGEGFAYGTRRKPLAGKEFGLVLMIGVAEREYQAGGEELFTISELTKPFQAMANKLGMIYLRPLSVFQFFYMEEKQKMDTLIRYWQMLKMERDISLANRENWLIDQLRQVSQSNLETADSEIIKFAIERVQENRDQIDELKMVLDDMFLE